MSVQYSDGISRAETENQWSEKNKEMSDGNLSGPASAQPRIFMGRRGEGEGGNLSSLTWQLDICVQADVERREA